MLLKCCLRNDCRNSIPMTCTCHYTDLGSVSDCFEANFPWGTTNKSHYPDHYGFSAVIFKLRIGNQWCHCKMSAVFSGCTFLSLFYMPWMQAHRLLSFKYMDRSVIILALFLWCCLLLLIFCKGGFFLSFWMHKECCHWNKSSWWTISSCRVVYYTLKHGSTFWVCQWNPLSSNFLWWRWW